MNPSLPRILLYPSVGDGYGIGNLMRCSVLSRVLRDRAKTFIVLPADMSVPVSIDRAVQRIDSPPEPRSMIDFDGVVYDWQGPLDAEDIFASWRKAAPNLAMVALDYFRLDSRALDAVFNLSPYSEVPLPGDSELEYCHGLQFGILRPEFVLAANEPGPPQPPPLKVLITFGGEDPGGWTMKTMQWLEREVTVPVFATVVVGPMNRNRDKIADLAIRSSRHRFEIRDAVADIHNHMRDCHIGFCGGGTTIMEMACIGRAAVALPQNAMEAEFLDLFRRKQFLVNHFGHELNNSCGILNRLCNDPDLRTQQGRIGRKLVDGKGAARIADAVIRHVKRRQKKTAGR